MPYIELLACDCIKMYSSIILKTPHIDGMLKIINKVHNFF